jgi:hypothetical protein
VLYRNYNITPIIAPSNPFVRSTGSKRYAITNSLFEFIEPPPKMKPNKLASEITNILLVDVQVKAC